MSADYTYDILVNIFGEDGLHKVGEAVEHLGLEIAHIKEISHGVGDAMTKEWQVAVKNISQAKKAQSEAIMAGHENVSVFSASQNYAAQDKRSDKEKQAELDAAFRYFKQIEAQLEKQRRLEVDGRAYIRALDEREAAQAESKAAREAAAHMKSVEARMREEMNYTSWWERELSKQESAHNKVINEIRDNALRAIENEKNDRQKAHAQEFSDMEKRHRENEKILKDLQKEANEFAKTASASSKASKEKTNHITSMHGQLQQLVNMTHKLRYAWLTVMTIFGGGHILHAFAGIGHAIKHQIKEAFHFNDDIRKGETVLTDVGISNLGMSQAEIGFRGNAAQKNQLGRAKTFGKDMVDMARQEALLTGQKFDEVIMLMKTTVPHVMNKLNTSGNGFLDKGNEVKEFSRKIIEYSALLKMIDPQNRALRFHEFGLLHMFYGTNDHQAAGAHGKKKADPTGNANFLSLLRREGIKLDDAAKSQITKLTNMGKMTEAMAVFDEAIKKSGLNLKMLADLSGNVLKVNIDAVTGAWKNLMVALTNPAYEYVLDFFRALRQYMMDIQNNDEIMAVIKQWGSDIASALRRAGMDLEKLSDGFAKMNFIDLHEQGKNIIDIFESMYNMGRNFITGFLTGDEKHATLTLKEIADKMKELEPEMTKVGAAARILGGFVMGVTKNFIDLIAQKDAIYDFWQSMFNPINKIKQVIEGARDAWKEFQGLQKGAENDDKFLKKHGAGTLVVPEAADPATEKNTVPRGRSVKQVSTVIHIGHIHSNSADHLAASLHAYTGGVA